MYNALRTAGLAAGIALMTAAGASAATVNLIATSTQGTDGAGNQADVFAPNHFAYTNGGASWDTDPTWTPPPGNEGSISQSPFNNTSLSETRSYFSVINDGAPGEGGGAASPATLSFGKEQTAFNMLWGSIDSYNEIEFKSGSSTVATWTGTNIVDTFTLDGNSPTFEQVALLRFDIADGFDSVEFRSVGSNSFEFALAPVPLPAGGLLLLTALGGVAALRRKRPTK